MKTYIIDKNIAKNGKCFCYTGFLPFCYFNKDLDTPENLQQTLWSRLSIEEQKNCTFNSLRELISAFKARYKNAKYDKNTLTLTIK